MEWSWIPTNLCCNLIGRYALSVKSLSKILFLVCVIVALGSLTLWQLWEQDVFWQLRAGDEILNGHSPQFVDTWSQTAMGQPWLNFWWLSCFFIRLLFGLGGISAFVMARCVGAIAVFTMVSLIMARARSTKGAWLDACLIPLFYAVVAFRIEVRAELFGLVLYSIFLWVGWNVSSPRMKNVTFVLFGILVTNLHAGIAPFFVLTAIAFCLGEGRHPISVRVIWSVAIALAIFINPFGIETVRFLWAHLLYGEHFSLFNADHLSFGLGREAMSVASLSPWAFLVWTAIGVGGVFADIAAEKQNKERLGRLIVLGLAGLALTALSVNRMRAIPYQAMFFSPFVMRFCEYCVMWITRRFPIAYSQRVAMGFGLSLWSITMGVALAHRAMFNVPFGLSLQKKIFPVGSTAFIAKERPSGPIFHSFQMGAYLVWYLRDYKTFVDTRQTPFISMEKTLLESTRDPGVLRELLARWSINIALMPVAEARFSPTGGFDDPVNAFLPYADWAIVYFDEMSVVHVRRVKENEALVRDHEYRLLRPHLPPTLYLLIGPRTTEDDEVFRGEVSRCRREEPRLLHCGIAEAALFREKGGTDSAQKALAILKSFSVKGAGNIFYLAELANVYRALGENEKAEEIGKLVGR